MRQMLPRPHIPKLIRKEPLLFIVVLLFAAAYATYSIVRHWHFLSNGFDLGIFDQEVWNFSNFQLGPSSLTDRSSQLGDHFSPILILLVPAYWIWSNAQTLLLAQAILVSASIVPVFLFSAIRIGRHGAYILAISYGLFWGIQSAIDFDFHEIAFAPLLIASAIYFADRVKWRSFFISIVLLLLVKEDMSLLVVFIGFYLYTIREFKRGSILIILGIIWYYLVTTTVIPYFSGGSNFQFWTYSEIGNNLTSALLNVVKDPGLVIDTFTSNPEKVRTTIYLFAPFLGLSIFSPLILLCIPLIAERMLSTNALFWGTKFQYSLAIAPILAMGAADGIKNILGFLKVRKHFYHTALSITILILIFNIILPDQLPLKRLGEASFYKRDNFASQAKNVVKMTPPDESILAQDVFISHLSNRKYIYELIPGKPKSNYIISSTTDERPAWPLTSARDRLKEIRKRIKRDGYIKVYDRDGFVIYRLKSLPGR